MLTDPVIALISALLLLAVTAMLLWPGYGFLSRWQRERRLTKRVLSEDALKHIYKYELQGRQPSMESIAGALNISLNQAAYLFAAVEADRLVRVSQGIIHLTPTGRETALHIIRAHRLWERYLAEETGYSEEAWHEKAEHWEHALSPEAADQLSAQLGHPTHDPHGDPIPTATGDMKKFNGQPLPEVASESIARIIHLEDEPEIVYAQLIAEGLHLGQIVRITESSPQRVHFWTNGNEHILAPIVASNISVVPLTSYEEQEADQARQGMPLSQLKLGQTSQVISISNASRGAERRRLFDLGIVPGTTVTAEMRSPGGDPTAYRIRGTLIALRGNQAKMIKIKTLESAS